MKRNHFVLKASVAAMATLLGYGVAHASTVTLASTPVFATEALVADTPVTIPAITYTNDTFNYVVGTPYRLVFTFSGDVSSDGTLTPADVKTTCIPLIEAIATQVQFECTTADIAAVTHNDFKLANVQVLGSAVLGATLTVTAQTQSREGLATYDQAGPADAGSSAQAIAMNLASDVEAQTTTNASDSLGPLFGFVSVGSDVAATGNHTFTVANNLTGMLCPDGSTKFDLNANCGDYVVAKALSAEITDTQRQFAGLANNGLTVSCVGVGGPQLFTFPPAVGTQATVANLTPDTTGFKAQGLSTTCTVEYDRNGTSSLGTTRTLGLSLTLAGGGQSDTFNNASFWPWGSNGAVIYAPFAYGGPGWNTRVQLTNLDTANDVAYAFKFYGEAASACVLDETTVNAATGTIPAGQTVTIPMTPNTTNAATYTAGFSPICSAITATTGSAQAGTLEATVATPINRVKGAMVSGFPGQIPQNVSMEPEFVAVH